MKPEGTDYTMDDNVMMMEFTPLSYVRAYIAQLRDE